MLNAAFASSTNWLHSQYCKNCCEETVSVWNPFLLILISFRCICVNAFYTSAHHFSILNVYCNFRVTLLPHPEPLFPLCLLCSLHYIVWCLILKIYVLHFTSLFRIVFLSLCSCVQYASAFWHISVKSRDQKYREREKMSVWNWANEIVTAQTWFFIFIWPLLKIVTQLHFLDVTLVVISFLVLFLYSIAMDLRFLTKYCLPL